MMIDEVKNREIIAGTPGDNYASDGNEFFPFIELPEEIQEEIVNFLSFSDRYEVLALVSTRMHKLAMKKLTKKQEEEYRNSEFYENIFQKSKTNTYLLLSTIYEKDHEEIHRLIHKEKTNINAKNLNGDSILHEIIMQDSRKPDKDFLALAIQNGADVNLQNKEGRTPLHYAVKYNATIKSLILLLELGANPNIQDSKGETPLHMASRLDKIKIIQTILRYSKIHPDVNIKNSQNLTALEIYMYQAIVPSDSYGHFRAIDKNLLKDAIILYTEKGAKIDFNSEVMQTIFDKDEFDKDENGNEKEKKKENSIETFISKFIALANDPSTDEFVESVETLYRNNCP